LHTDVAGLDPQATYAEPYNKWKCERLSDKPTPANGQQCWIPSTATDEGVCGEVVAGSCTILL